MFYDLIKKKERRQLALTQRLLINTVTQRRPSPAAPVRVCEY